MQRTTPLVTTVIPTYRRPALLRRAILSALNQTYPNLQVCVYDNASGDETAAVVAELMHEDSRVKYHCHKTNMGMSSNISFGIAQVSTPFFSYLADDDYLLPDFYHTALQGFERYPDAIFSAGSVISTTENGVVTHVPLQLWEREGYFAPPEGLFVWTIQRHPNIIGLLFRREVIDKVGFYDPGIYHADFEFEWRVASRFPYVVSRTPCAAFVVHEHQASRMGGAAIWMHSFAIMRRRLAENDLLSRDARERADAVLQDTFARALFIAGLTTSRDGNFQQGRQFVYLLRRDFNARRSSMILAVVLMICASVPPLRRALNLYYEMLLRRRTRNNRWLQEYIMAHRPN